jgi:cytochrome d ubiquinol oxidase subunit II
METVWFVLIAAMIALYVVFDGFDLGAGALHPFVARTESERRMVLRAIGPVWDGNEVWLIAGGGSLYFAFPALYASSFSGFYLPLMIVLWLLILRGISIEFRNHLESPVWAPLWDAVLCGASGSLAVFFGAALGNVVRGVPLDASGRFFAPLWTDLKPYGHAGILDWYTLLVAAAALLAVVFHGALWIALKTSGALQARARRMADWTWVVVAPFTLIVTFATMRVQPQVVHNLSDKPWGFVFPATALVGLTLALYFSVTRHDAYAFLASGCYLVGMLASAAFGVYPFVLPSTLDPAFGLTVSGAAAPAHGLRLGLAWWIPGMLLVTGYFVFIYRHFRGKVDLEGSGEGD